MTWVLTWERPIPLFMSRDRALCCGSHLSWVHRVALLIGIVPLYNFIGFFVRYLASMLRKRESQLVYSVFHDELTGLPSRELFMERLRQALTRAEVAKTEGRDEYRFAVLFIDLDRFKGINDRFGHQVGDTLLVEAARRLEACVKSTDTVSHMGGDEYTILLEDLTDESITSRVSERIQEVLSVPFKLDGHEAFTSASIGIALSVTGYRVAEDILRDAHTAMYRAKAQGRARAEIFQAAMRPDVVSQMELETDLRHVIERHELFLQYQPIMALADNTLAGFEALVRWNHPTRGLIRPDLFIRLAEDIGLIVPIDRWVLRTAARQLRKWQTQFPTTSLEISVNLSAKHFAESTLYDDVARVLTEAGGDPHRLNFEITESVLIENPEAVTAQITRFRQLGIHFHIDDFGTGYSSLSYLRGLHVEQLKIDRSFIGRIEQGGKDLELVRDIVILAHGLDIGVIAEGVETAEQLEVLQRIRCDYGQGFYFSQPMDVEAATALLAENAKAQ